MPRALDADPTPAGSGALHIIDTISTPDAATLLMADPEDPSQLFRIRWAEGDPPPTAPDATRVAGSLGVALATREPTEDLMLGLAVRADTSVELQRWSWPERADATAEPIDSTPLADFHLSGSFWGRIHSAPMGDGTVALAILDTARGGGRVVILDRELRHIVGVQRFDASSLPPRGALVRFGPNAVALAGEHVDRSTTVWSVTVDSLEPRATLAAPFIVSNAAGADDGAFYVSTPVPSATFVDPEERMHDSPLLLARIGADPPAVEGGQRPVLTGDCSASALGTPPGGGVVIATNCLDQSALDLVYACIPGIE